ncbi:hypothetical protein GQ53DRAFT_49427 [Thozetella sp. PMI_491]|nr:hypothetical protein GQ53DRAFT_49427 [Thozetella sp. PMI_491]
MVWKASPSVTSAFRARWRQWPDCLSLDATYKTNCLQWSLVLVVVTTPEKITILTFQSLISNETEESYKTMVNSMRECRRKAGIPLPGIVLTDGAQGAELALKARLPEARV